MYGTSFAKSKMILLKELDSYENWRKLNKMQAKKKYRFTKQELILRYFAFNDNLNSYNGKLAQFLNEYMSENQKTGNNAIPSETKVEK